LEFWVVVRISTCLENYVEMDRGSYRMTAAQLAYRNGSEDIDERNELIVQELPQVYYIAARIRERLPQHVEMEDLVNAGVIGLIEASRKFDSTKNTQFSTFAKFRIRGAILDSLRELDWGSRALRKQGRAITSSIAKLSANLGRHPLQEEIAADLQLDLGKFQDLLAQLDGLHVVGQRSDSVNDSDVPHDLVESAPSRGGDNPFDLCLEGEMKEQLAIAVSQLSEREQLILLLYYHEELTMREIAETLSCTVSRISQMHTGAIFKLRASLKHLNEGTATPPKRMQLTSQNTEYCQMGN
jgi:RNA polymerase sigma factor FliA